MKALLQVTGLSKRFGGLHAVKDVSFDLQPRSITGVLGPNGAGKTTMFNLLTGFIRPDAGTILFDDHSLIGLVPHQIVNRGLARTFQLARPLAGLSVVENVELACLAPRVRSSGKPRERAHALLDQVNLGGQAEFEVDVLRTAIYVVWKSREPWQRSQNYCYSMNRSRVSAPPKLDRWPI
jgi:branched-chain amino acid transport system ATP-binding protein